MLKLRHPSTCCIVGPSQSGKSSLVRQMLHNNVYDYQPQKIKWCYYYSPPSFINEASENVEFVNGLPENYEDVDLLVIDDLMLFLDEKVAQLFTVISHHCRVSCILILQNLYFQNKYLRTISLNTHYMILFKNARDMNQINCLGRQLYPSKSKFFLEAYKSATADPFSYLLVDIHPLTSEKYRLRDSLFPDSSELAPRSGGEEDENLYKQKLSIALVTNKVIMAKKMALVPPDLLAAYRRPKALELDLEQNILNLLDESQLPNDQRAKLLSQLIMRYQKTAREPAPPIPVTIADKPLINPPEELPAMDIEDEDPILRDIRYTVPRAYEKYVPAIVEKLKTRLYHWNENGEMTENGVPFKGSKIVDLFSYVMRNSKKLEKPLHLEKFIKAIIDINIPHSWISNKNVLRQLKAPDSPSDDFDFSPIKDNSRRVSTPLLSPHRRRSRSAGERAFEREVEPPWKMRSQSYNKWIEY
ncbi:hypothetical protein HNY73_009967 [Argiope bruennichi]|uniref:AAA+ ATPase domain-containing protein n=1 Tax=Argiope bruennichi TaxID=94029 RepID=A0A8T0F5H1_ARGBR|nr:hypothetical protein HNY73_009967 [Argiope bruennichi]